MSKTVTFTDATWAEITSLVLGTAPVVTPPTPTPIPDPVPPGVNIIGLPWASTIGRQVAKITPGVTLAFKVTVPMSGIPFGALHNFTQSPTDGNAYFFRNTCLSDKPGDFTGGSFPLAVTRTMQGASQDARIRFTVGTPYTRPVPAQYAGILQPTVDPSVAVLIPGGTYYFNVRQTDPTLTCYINYSLHVL